MDRVLVIGAAVVDVVAVGSGPLVAGDSNPGRVGLAVGGVAKNLAEDLTRLGVPVELLTWFGDDAFAATIRAHLEAAGVKHPLAPTVPGPSGQYVSLHGNDGTLVAAVNDFSVFETLGPADLARFDAYIRSFPVLVLDCNLPAAVLDLLTSRHRDQRIVVDGVSRAKVARIRPFLDRIWLLKVNRGELAALLGGAADDVIYGVKDLLAEGVRTVVVTNGPDPITYNIDHRIYQTAIFASRQPVSSSGCGDALLAGTLYGLLRGLSLHEAVNRGKKAAMLTMEVAGPCTPVLRPDALEE